MQQIFAADIGGTNARFARFSSDGGLLALEAVEWGASSGLRDADDVLALMRRLLGTAPAAGDALAVALAGPVRGLAGNLTNGSLRLDLSDAAARLRLRACVLLNDFAAEAYATLTETGAKARHVCGPEGVCGTTAPRAVLGAGTGLGAASLHWLASGASGGQGDGRGRWHAVPSEVGHAPFPFAGGEELGYQEFLAEELGRDSISVEEVLSGRGLARLHHFLTGKREDAAVVGREALGSETPTLQWYARFLGRFCRAWICATLCTGGLWIAGGIAARNPLCVASPAFRQALTAGNGLPRLVESVPVRLASTTDSGLWGAARAVLECA